MIKHIVLFKLKNPGKDIEKAKTMLMSMKGKVDMIKSIEVGEDIMHTDRSYDIALIVTLESLESLCKYHNDEYHHGVVRACMRDIAESSVIVDYNI